MPPRLSFPTLIRLHHRRTLTTKPPPFPTTPICPSPTCHCAPTPSFPPTHPIDHTTPLNGVMPAYISQVLLCTGVDDWTSRIEDENGGDNAAVRVKGLYGPRGALFDLRYNISVLNSSFKSSSKDQTSAFVLPSFAYFPTFPPSPPPRLPLPPSAKVAGAVPLRDVMVLICGHGGRDLRCGVMGPLLRGEFEEKLAGIAGLSIHTSPPEAESAPEEEKEHAKSEVLGARVGVISHIGGHKFAGNAIVYIPPDMRSEDGLGKHALAGMGIWYGRVEPRHVEGIVRETVMGGRVVEELFRGGIDAEGKMVRL